MGRERDSTGDTYASREVVGWWEGATEAETDTQRQKETDRQGRGVQEKEPEKTRLSSIGVSGRRVTGQWCGKEKRFKN